MYSEYETDDLVKVLAAICIAHCNTNTMEPDTTFRGEEIWINVK